MEETWWIYMIGFAAQLLFTMRSLTQWMISEKAKKIMTPLIFWKLSIAASYLFSIYGWLRNDCSIVLGQSISYYVYIWNLSLNDIWKRLSNWFKAILLGTPVALTILVWTYNEKSAVLFPYHKEMSNNAFWLGIGGQLVFNLRFLYQWVYSNIQSQSLLPIGFWMLSLLGSSAIIIYGIIRHDPVLIIGQAFGWIIYVRNIWIGVTMKIL